MIITKKTIDRRTVLRGLGTALALPLLDSMVPALAAARQSTASAPLRRLGFVYVPNGVNVGSWTPNGTGGALSLSPTLAPLAPFRDRVTVVSHLNSFPAEARGDGGGDHVRASAAWLTGSRPKKTQGADIYCGKSLDQFAADELGKETQFRSLQLAADDTVNVCDGYACSYQNTLSWATPTTPLPMQNNPRVVFERLFGAGDATGPDERRRFRQTQASILDDIGEEALRLAKKVGASDRARLNDYLAGVREVERRIQKMEKQAAIEFSMEIPTGVPEVFDDQVKLMFDLQVLAFQTDLTRVSTFMVCRETSQRTYVKIGVPEAHHGLSHHGDDPEFLEKLGKIDNYHVGLLAYYIEKLAATQDGEGSLLDHSLIVYGSNISNGNTHSNKNVPMVVVGGGAGQVRGGRHIVCPDDTPLTNLQLTLLHKLGIQQASFGDSTGELSEL